MISSNKRGIRDAPRHVKSPLALVPLLFFIVALPLSLICVLAGKHPGYYENVNLLTVNASRIGHIDVHFNLSSKHIFQRQLLLRADTQAQDDDDQDLLDILKDKGNDAVQDITEKGQEVLQNVTNEAVDFVADKVAQALHLHDFYSAHILTYCEGYYTPSPLPNITHPSRKNVTRCSKPKALFHFNPSQIVTGELVPGINLTDIHWPQKIEDAAKALEAAFNALFIFYCLGIGMTGLALIGAIVGLFVTGKGSLAINAACSMLAFFFLLMASAITTAILVKLSNAINEHGNVIGLAAYKGHTFLGMTWAATILTLLGFTVLVILFIRGRGKRRETEKQSATLYG